MAKKDIDYTAVENLYNEGLSDAKIAKQLDISTNVVFRWRKENNKPSHNPGNRSKRQSEPTKPRDPVYIRDDIAVTYESENAALKREIVELKAKLYDAAVRLGTIL